MDRATETLLYAGIGVMLTVLAIGVVPDIVARMSLEKMVLVTSLVHVAAAAFLGWSLRCLVTARGQSVRPRDFGRKWMAYMFFIGALVALPPFIGQPSAEPLAKFVLIVVVYGGLAFGAGWLYGRYKLSRTQKKEAVSEQGNAPDKEHTLPPKPPLGNSGKGHTKKLEVIHLDTKTKVILGVALIIASAMMLFPPERGGGYDFIFDIRGVDGAKLLVQLGLLTLLTVALYVGAGWIAAHRSACVKSAQIAATIAVLVVAGVAAVNYLPSVYKIVNPQYAEQVSRQSTAQGNTIRIVPVDYDPFTRRNPQVTAWKQDAEFNSLPTERQQGLIGIFFDDHVADEEFWALPPEKQQDVRENFLSAHLQSILVPPQFAQIAQDDLDFSFLEDPRYIELSFEMKKAVFYDLASQIFERYEEYLALSKDQQAMVLNRRWRYSLENSGNQSIAAQ